MTERIDGTIVTPEFTALFPNLFEPKPYLDPKTRKPKGEPVYGLSMLFAPADIAAMKEKAKAVALAKWPGRPLSELKFPFQDGDKLAAKSEANRKDGTFYKGTVVIKASSKFQPQVVGADKNPILDKGKVYSGIRGYAELNFHAYDGVNGGQDGVKAYVNFVMKSADGKRIAGKDAATVFAGIKGGASGYDPTKGSDLDDDIPL